MQDELPGHQASSSEGSEAAASSFQQRTVAPVTSIFSKCSVSGVQVLTLSSLESGGKTVVVSSPDGSRSENLISPDGSLDVSTEGKVDAGRPGEMWVVLNLKLILFAEGLEVGDGTRPPRDEDGEDWVLSVAGRDYVVQITTLPSKSCGPRRPRRTHTISANEARELIDGAIARKTLATPPAVQGGVILALDGRHLGGLAWPHPTPGLTALRSQGFRWAGVYFVGPTAEASFSVLPVTQ